MSNFWISFLINTQEFYNLQFYNYNCKTTIEIRSLIINLSMY